ncbi:hypothetical protein KP509_08G025000 [Ceratopteris richardii]|uniref:RING-type E3 ubiquitin transferase n=1 Tax=Ceratopteris richardii TaxID=49495 RepID=A0A8T2UEX6_CERRI|nr:hypothetical protein KP509_08G025000 [Ceratopteris richardii]
MDHSSSLHGSLVLWRKRNPVIKLSSLQHPPDPLFLPLLYGLIISCREFSHWKKPDVCQTLNVATACRRAACLLPLFEDVFDGGASIPPSALTRFRRLRSIFLNMKGLLHNCRHRSKLLLLMEQDILASQFHVIAFSIADSLAYLPFELLDISEDTREYIKLVQIQCSADAAPFIDPSERVLQAQVLAILSALEEGVSPDKENLKHIFEVLCFNGSEDCEQELWLLEKEREKLKSEQDYRQIRTVISLIGLVRYVRCLLYELEMGIQVTSTCIRHELPCPSVSEVVLRSYKQTEGGSAVVPDDFKCPISLEIMVDPVAISTGQSYERASITRWLEEGHTTCPKTGSDLVHYNLTPNSTLRRIITQWCADNDYVLDSDAARKAASAGTPVVSVRTNTKAALEFTKLTAKVLIAKLSNGSIAAQRRAAYELRVMAKDGEETCSCLASAGAIRALTTVLESSDIMTQENAVTAMHNLSINDENKNIIVATEGALDGIVRVLTMKTSSIVARANAAAALFSISKVKAHRTTIASREAAIEGLMQLSREGSPTAKKDAAITLLSLALVDTISAQLLEKGIVLSVVETLEIETQMRKGWTEELLALLTLLLRTPDGLAAVRAGSSRIAWIFVKMIAEGSGWLQENAVTLLLAMCSDQVEAEGSAAFHREQLRRNPAFLPDLQRLVDAENPRTQLKAFHLLKWLNTSIHSSPSLTSVTRK